MVKGERWIQDEDLALSASSLATRFIQRWDIYSKQLDDGRYLCIHKPLRVDHIYAHLRGEITLGTYLLDVYSQASFVVLDHDGENSWGQMVRLAGRLARDSIPAYLEKSRRGGHLWIFFAKPIPGECARSFALDIIKKYHQKAFEIFPKQNTIKSGPGSLIRLPFGIHQLSGTRYGFFTPEGKQLGNIIQEQIDLLRQPNFVPEDILQPYMIQPMKTPIISQRRRQPASDQLSEKIKARKTVLEFVKQYVQLRKTPRGWIGLCPFHNDHHPSFGVNEQENYWHCFAGCGGGSLIDFWSLWRKKQGLDATFLDTVRELADMLF